MADQDLRYDLMVENALRGVVRQALGAVAATGLPGDHHFYITFRTGHPGAELPDYLRTRYPDEMTIVVQYQFWGLKVADDHFEITLSFNEKPERLSIPFEAVTAFADPSVRFGLQFDAGEDKEVADAKDADGDRPPEATHHQRAADQTETSAPATDKVVTLDAFRSKK